MKFTIIVHITCNTHLVQVLELIIDWPKFETLTFNILEKEKVKSKYPRYTTKLAFNSGSNRYFGHKIYVGFTQLILTDYIIFLYLYNLITKYNLYI